MSWSYSGDPSSSAKDEIRFLTRDTDVARPWTLQDEEINYTVGLYSAAPPVIGQNFFAAAVCADAIVAALIRLMALTKSVGDLHLSVNPSILAEFKMTAQHLWSRANVQGVPVYSGGQTWSDKALDYSDTDKVQNGVKVDQFNRNNREDDETGWPVI